jgi:hypothetical protein
VNFKEHILLIIIGASCIFEISCTSSVLAQRSTASEAEANKMNVDNLAAADPNEDFARAKSKGDIYFLAMRGFTTEVPGVEGKDEQYLKGTRTVVIEGTSDVVGGNQGRQLRQKVRSYAIRYNKLVLELLRQRVKRKE